MPRTAANPDASANSISPGVGDQIARTAALDAGGEIARQEQLLQFAYLESAQQLRDQHDSVAICPEC